MFFIFCVGKVFRFRLFVYYAEYSFRRGKCGLKFIQYICKFVYRPRKFSRILHELRDTSERYKEYGSCLYNAALRIHIQYSAEDYYKGDGEIVYKVYGRTEKRRVVFRFVICVHGVCVSCIKARAYLVFSVVRGDTAAAGEHFFGVSVKLAEFS